MKSSKTIYFALVLLVAGTVCLLTTSFYICYGRRNIDQEYVEISTRINEDSDEDEADVYVFHAKLPKTLLPAYEKPNPDNASIDMDSNSSYNPNPNNNNDNNAPTYESLYPQEITSYESLFPSNSTSDYNNIIINNNNDINVNVIHRINGLMKTILNFSFTKNIGTNTSSVQMISDDEEVVDENESENFDQIVMNLL
eukprot:Pgem_evm1s6261